MNLIPLLQDTAHLKTCQLRLDILKTIIEKGSLTVSDLSKDITLSIPTISKMIGEMVESGLLYESGKSDNHGERKASLYDINHEAGYFIGIDIGMYTLIAVLCDFTGNIINEKEYSFTLEDSEESYNKLISLIEDFLSGISIPLQKVENMGI